jgi:hypothetical protein
MYMVMYINIYDDNISAKLVQSPQTQVAQLAATSTRLMDRLGQHTQPEAGPHFQGDQNLRMIKVPDLCR